MMVARISPLLLSLFVTLPASERENVDISRLRAGGQSTVLRLAGELEKGDDRPSAERILDRVCAQRDCAASRLFWETDVKAAETRATEERKPMLMLRLLGRLDEDLSCANSRFFRTAVYSDPRVSAFMRENFVLAWTSERPAPRVTIDYGDGRTIQRTITGNSVHYLIADGVVLDVLPGLYAPDTFLQQLRRFVALHRAFIDESDTEREQFLRAHHLKEADLQPEPAVRATAYSAAPLAVTKAIVETPLLTRVSFGSSEGGEFIDPASFAPAPLHQKSVELMRAKHGDDSTFEAAQLLFRRSLAADTHQNESELRPIVHRWLSERQWSFEELNSKIYSELFLTPRNDPWLGLVASDAFTAIDPRGSIRVRHASTPSLRGARIE